MLNHLTWQKFRKSLISMAGRDAKKRAGGALTFSAERFLLKLSFMNILCLSFEILQHPDWKLFIAERHNGARETITPCAILSSAPLAKGAGARELPCECRCGGGGRRPSLGLCAEPFPPLNLKVENITAPRKTHLVACPSPEFHPCCWNKSLFWEKAFLLPF